MSFLLRDVTLHGGWRGDVRIAGEQVMELAAHLAPVPQDQVVDGGGAALLPGLHDHHLHLLALAAAAGSLSVRPEDGGLSRLATATATATAGTGWLRAVGAADDVDRTVLDRLVPDRPVRVQHRSGALWTVNSAGARALGLADVDLRGVERDAFGAVTGRLWRLDAWLAERVGRTAPDLAAVGRQLAAAGITGLTDASPDLDAASQNLLVDADLPQRLLLLGGSGETSTVRVALGPWKVVLADSALPPLDDLVDVIRRTHTSGRAVALHVVSRDAAALAVAALCEARVRPGDRLEHGAVLAPDVVRWLARTGVCVVTQPGFIADRGDDYLREVEARDLPDLYRVRSLLDAGVPVALSSDSPYGPGDPWQVMAAAVARRARSGTVLGAAERLTATAALDALLRPLDGLGAPARRVVPGKLADLVLLHVPLGTALSELVATNVRQVWCAGRLVHPEP